MKTKKSIKIEELNLLQHMEIINARLENSKLELAVLNEIKVNLNALADAIGCNLNQAMLFSIIFGLNFNSFDVNIEDIAKYFKCSCLRIVGMMSDFDALVQKKLLKKTDANPRERKSIKDSGFYMSSDILDKVQSGKFNTAPNNTKLTTLEFLSQTWELYEIRQSERTLFCELTEEINQLINNNPHLPFFFETKKMTLDDREKHLLLILCYYTLNGYEYNDLDEVLKIIYPTDMAYRFGLRKDILKGYLSLQKNEIIELEDGIFRSDRTIILTEKGIELFLSEESQYIEKKEKKQSTDLINSDDIKAKELFFNLHENEQLHFLESAFLDENLKKLQQRLKEKKLPEGIAILFYGKPGTGKTESAYQLARKTGRSIMMVDISSTKTMWFGESEKLIKKVFDKYKTKVENSKITPILLFNEADAIFSKRKDTNFSSVSQTENAIQNIILQEMEQMKGILIATTNLTDNFDNAFERRFLYKIQFEKPEQEVQAKIWNSKMENLTDNEAMLLANKYSFTGGQIDNICRKCFAQEVLKGINPDIDAIQKFCSEENILHDYRKIGF